MLSSALVTPLMIFFSGAALQVGTILLFVRISRNNRMLPFSSQTLDLVHNFLLNRPPGEHDLLPTESW